MKNPMVTKLGLALVATLLATPVWSAGFGFTGGAQIEERMGSEYGAEYYYRRSNEAQPRKHRVRVKTRSGHRVLRCR